MSPPPGVRACPACQRIASSGRRFCGGCRAVLVRSCGACGFGNELDDHWCGGCGRAIPAVPAARVLAPPSTPSEPRRGDSRSGPTPSPIKARPPVFPGAAAAMLAINRRRGEPAPSAPNDDVQDQEQLDALFGGGK